VLFVLVFAILFLSLWAVFYVAGPVIEKVLARAANWTARFRYGDYLPVLIVLAIGFGLTAFAGDAFLDIAERLHAESSKLHQVDSEVHAWARTTRTNGATRFFTTMTLIGTPVGLGILVAVACLALVMRGRWRWAAYLFFTSAVGGLLNLQLKAFFERARPELAEALRNASGYSFPSGHAMGSTFTFAAFAYLAFRIVKTWRWRAVAISFALSMIAAIAASRIYLGVHWISDIGAGIAAGTIWFATTTVAYETFRRIRLIRELRKRAAQQ
jgi:undecaprenyl-diphosphatase